MDKKIFHVYLAKEGVPNNESYAKLDLPASPWELWDAMEKVRLNEGEQLYMEIEDYDAFAYLQAEKHSVSPCGTNRYVAFPLSIHRQGILLYS